MPFKLLSDDDDRIRDFFARHGGADPERAQERSGSEIQGWSKIYAADGYILRCDWTMAGTKEALAFTEIPPAASASDPQRSDAGR